MKPTQVANAITQRREKLGWSKRRLSREAHLSAPFIVQIENGERTPSPRTIALIADALGVHPYVLLAEAGTIDPAHVAEAERLTKAALERPEVAAHARTHDTGGAFAWVVADYLNMLGDDAYGTETTGPLAVDLDWSELAPERWAALLSGKVAAARTSDLLAEARDWAETFRMPPTPIEGWAELTDTQRRLVQQLVNQMRKPSTGGGTPDGNE